MSRTAEEVAKETIQNCPTEHIREGLALHGIGTTSFKVGEGCACQGCIQAALLSLASERTRELEELQLQKVVDAIASCHVKETLTIDGEAFRLLYDKEIKSLQETVKRYRTALEQISAPVLVGNKPDELYQSIAKEALSREVE